KLWSGCIAGAFREDEFLEMFESVGFYGVEILQRQKEPWQVIDGIEFRSITVRAYKGKEGPCLERHQSVIYKGPWKSVQDDDGHHYQRGKRMAVCDKTFRILTHSKGPYTKSIEGIEPVQVIEIDSAQEFLCKANAIRDPRQLKGSDYRETRGPEEESRGPSCC
ncbi:MAG: methyltransferase, partial [Planctomycetes bacterium]|nr:methyltransferase [Planctomycetota bacterium]